MPDNPQAEFQQMLAEVINEISSELGLGAVKLDGYYREPYSIIHDDHGILYYEPLDEGRGVYETTLQFPISVMAMNHQTGETDQSKLNIQFAWRFHAESPRAAFELVEAEGEHKLEQARGLFEKKSNEKQRRVILAGAQALRGNNAPMPGRNINDFIQKKRFGR